MPSKKKKLPGRPKDLPFKPDFYLALFAIILVVHLVLLLMVVNRPFVAANEDDNAAFGLAAMNLARFGFVQLKFGMVTSYFDTLGEIGMGYYTHHPQWFIMPTAVLYSLLGVSEAATRLPSIILSAIALVAFYVTVYLYRRDRWLALFSSFAYALFPGVVHYSSSLSEKAFVLGFSTVAIMVFFLHREYPSRLLRAALVAIVVLGGLQGWQFFFVPVALWVFAVVKKDTPDRRFLLIMLPLAAVATFGANFLHFYILKGGAFAEIFQAFAVRSGRLPIESFSVRYVYWLNNNFTWPAVLIGLGFLFYEAEHSLGGRRFDLPLIYSVQPLLTLLVFQQWSSHGFGPIFWAPFLALAVGSALTAIARLDRRAIALVGAGLLMAGFIFLASNSLETLRANSLLMENDVGLLRDIAARAPPSAQIALGEESSGQMYGALVEWYLQRNVHKNNWKDMGADIIVSFNPDLGPEYAAQNTQIEQGGYEFRGTTGLLSLFQRK